MNSYFFRGAPALLAASLGLLASPAGAQTPPAPGPVVELAPEHTDEPPPKPIIALGQGRVSEAELSRGLVERRFRSALDSLGHTSIGGYGELQVIGLASGKDAPRQWSADVRRMVLFVAHSFNDKIRAYTEFEFEHVREAEIEQAFVDWKVAGDALGLRAGLILVPMGILNEVHEPPTFNGVVRPRVETVVIPSTWREIGAGIFGHPTESLRYQLYGMTAYDPLAIDAGGLAGARGGGALSKAKAWAAVGRVEYEPVLGFVVGASGYASDAGGNGSFFLRDRTSVDVRVPILGYTLDARFRRAGLEWKALFAEWHLPTAAALMHTFDAAGKPLFADATRPVPTRIRGAYVEAGYDVLRPLGVSHQLVPFARLEAYDTQSAVPDGFTANPTYSVREYTFGVSYRPLREVVVKADYQLRNRKAGPDETQINTGIGFMY
jgi:roadblock/LC7 domain-containing protein